MSKKKKPIGCLIVFGIFLIFVASMIIPALMKARRSAWSAQCLSNVRQLGQACKMYAIDHDGHFPDSLVQLYPDYTGGDLQCFFCPDDYDGHPPKHIETFNETSISYSIVPGLSESVEKPGETILVYEKSIWNHAGKNVFFVDGHAKRLGGEQMVKADFDKISGGLSSFFKDKGRYPTNEEGLVILVAYGYLKNVSVDVFDRDGIRPYDYATKNGEDNWILTSYGPDEDQDINLKLYSNGDLSSKELLRLKAKLVALHMTIKYSNGDYFRVGP